MPSKKSLDKMTVDELDAEMARADDAATEAINYKREVGAALQAARNSAAAEAKVDALSDTEAAALAEALAKRVDASAKVGTLAMTQDSNGVG